MPQAAEVRENDGSGEKNRARPRGPSGHCQLAHHNPAHPTTSPDSKGFKQIGTAVRGNTTLGYAGTQVKLSRASTYAFYGLVCIAEQPPGSVVPLSQIGTHYKVPEKHLAKIFQLLVKAGVLRSVRGTNGGFALAKQPDQISALDVIEIIDGPSIGRGCLLLEEPCEIDSVCRINAIWRDAQQQMLSVLRSATLADMVTPASEVVRQLGKRAT